MRKRMQTDTHQPRNGEVSDRDTVPALKMSYHYRFLTSCCKMTDVFDREQRYEQEMDNTLQKMANGHSPAKKW